METGEIPTWRVGKEAGKPCISTRCYCLSFIFIFVCEATTTQNRYWNPLASLKWYPWKYVQLACPSAVSCWMCMGCIYTDDWVKVFLLDSYLLCCLFGTFCLHLEPFNGHLNKPLLCQEWIPPDEARLRLHSSWSSPAAWAWSDQLRSCAVRTEDWQLAKMPCG